jgi:Asp-tRNA(Asn)/Glu-tRNA(Gln) amidotransferase A subunit family amidase
MIFRAELGRRKSATDAASAEMVQAAIYQRVRALFDRHDLLMLPTTPTTAFPIGVDYPAMIAGRPVPTPFHQLGLTYLFNMTGHPAISIPAGWTAEGLPVGLQIVGPWRDDAAVLRAAAAFEQAAPWRPRWPDLDALSRQ